jgi:pyruvate/2-oxoglutarate dehydrogenase complex dihydrolipoamide dehydrogenase (E3) component
MGYGPRVTQSVDVIVLGMGPGGEDAAGKLAEAGLDVIGIDHRLVGGECPYWGCVPSKMMICAATSAGPCGGEVLSMLTLAIHARVPVDTLRTMIYAYPTFHRGVEDALRDLEGKLTS